MKELRDHVITVRLTQSEYQCLKSTCGADLNSISTVVRKTVMEWAGSNGKPAPKTDELLGEVSQKLDILLRIFGKGLHE